jgi:hypothetical protein
MLDDFANGKITDLAEMPTVNNWNNSFFGALSRKVIKVDTEVHHIVPEALVKQFKITGSLLPDFSVNNVPGHAYTKDLHKILHNGNDGMNSLLLNNPAFLDLPDATKATQIVAYYTDRGYVSLGAVANAWFKKNGIL